MMLVTRSPRRWGPSRLAIEANMNDLARYVWMPMATYGDLCGHLPIMGFSQEYMKYIEIL